MNLDKKGIRRKETKVAEANLKFEKISFAITSTCLISLSSSSMPYNYEEWLPLRILEFRILSKCLTLPSKSFQDDLKLTQQKSKLKYDIKGSPPNHPGNHPPKRTMPK